MGSYWGLMFGLALWLTMVSSLTEVRSSEPRNCETNVVSVALR